MQDPASANDDLNELERQLAALVPSARVDRDRLMYAAGRRAGQRHLRVTQRWLAVTSAGCGAMLAVVVMNPMWAVDREPRPATAIAKRPEPAAAFQLTAQSDRVLNDPAASFRLRQQLAAGVPHDIPRSDHGETPLDAVEHDAARSDSRWLLNHYLADPHTRL